MVDFIQSNKVLYGFEAICKILPISPSTYYRQLDLTENPEKRSKRDLHDQLSIMLNKLSGFGRKVLAAMGFVKYRNN